MGSGASSFKMSAGGAAPNTRPSWLASPEERVLPLNEKKFTPIVAIGSGKFGFVYLAKHESKKCVAIKYISKAFVAECRSVDRIRSEIEVLKRLDHPFIIHCYGGFDTPACIGLVFEYALGGELFTHMKKGGRMNEQHAKFYFAEMATALDYLHNTIGVVYRDIKPENVLLDMEGHCKLCDFGFCVPVQDNPLHDGCGTAMYVAPEIASGFMKHAHGFPVDWWGLGCVLAEMVTGQPPFGDIEHTSKFEIFTNITEKSPSLSYGMSGALKTLVNGLLTKDPAQRWEWTKVRSAAWCGDIEWDDVLARSITPPWQPKISASPSSENFVSWNNLVLPTAEVSSEVRSYCSPLLCCKGDGCRTSSRSLGIKGGGASKGAKGGAASGEGSSPGSGGGGGGGRARTASGSGAVGGGRGSPVAFDSEIADAAARSLSATSSPALGQFAGAGAAKGQQRKSIKKP